MMKCFSVVLVVLLTACGSKAPPASPQAVPGERAAPAEPAPEVRAELLAAETAAFERAKPVLDRFCASCHVQGQRNATRKKLDHFDMTSYPFGGHHAGEMAATMRKVLAIGGGTPTMPKNEPGAVTGDDLALLAAWADAFEAAHEGGAHQGTEHHHHGGHTH